MGVAGRRDIGYHLQQCACPDLGLWTLNPFTFQLGTHDNIVCAYVCSFGCFTVLLVQYYIGDHDASYMSVADEAHAAGAISAVNLKLPSFWPSDPHLSLGFLWVGSGAAQTTRICGLHRWKPSSVHEELPLKRQNTNTSLPPSHLTLRPRSEILFFTLLILRRTICRNNN